MTTCAPLTADLGAVQLTFFQEESPAKDSAEQARDSESLTPATSGRTRSASSKNAAPRGSSSKTWTALLRSTIGVSFSKTLRRQGMMLAGVCYPLEMWALPTFASGSGCSPQIPTPSACNANEGEPFATWEARRLRTKERVGNGNGFGTPLSMFVQQWPTPTSTLASNGGRVTPDKAREGGTLIEALSARTNWPTPRANDAEKRGQIADDPRNGLAGAVQWATPTTPTTPTTRDHKSGKASQATHDRNSRPLSEQVGDLLNPTWVEWLMGWPINWTDPDGGPSSEDFHEWLEGNRTALTAYVAAATVKFHSPNAQPGNF